MLLRSTGELWFLQRASLRDLQRRAWKARASPSLSRVFGASRPKLPLCSHRYGGWAAAAGKQFWDGVDPEVLCGVPMDWDWSPAPFWRPVAATGH